MNAVNILELFKLDGKVAIITGASMWLGYDIAAALAEAGADIVITSRTLSRAQKATEKIQKNCNVDTLAVEMRSTPGKVI